MSLISCSVLVWIRRKAKYTVPMPYQQIIETEAKPVPLKYIYTTSHFPGLIQALQYELAGLNWLNRRKSHLSI